MGYAEELIAKKKKKKTQDQDQEKELGFAEGLIARKKEIIRKQNEERERELEAEKEAEKQAFLKQSAYVGPTPKKEIATALDVSGNILQGGLNAVEGVADFGRYVGADFLDLVGADNKAQEIRNKAKENDIDAIVDSFQRITQGDLAGKKTREQVLEDDFVRENSFITDESKFLGANVRQIFQGVGNTIGYALMTGYLGKASKGAELLGTSGKILKGASDLAPIYMSARGSGTTEAYLEAERLGIDITDAQARWYGRLSGGIEAMTESLFGGLGKAADKLGVSKTLGLGKGALDDKLIGAFTKRFKSTLMKNLVDLGIRSTGEGVEEVLSSLFGAFAKKLTYMKDEDLGKLLKEPDYLEEFMSGTLSSLFTQTPSNVSASIKGTETTTGITKNENKVVEAIVQERVNQEIDRQKANNKEKIDKLTNKEVQNIRNEVREDLQNGFISTDMIEKTLGKNYDVSNDSYLQEAYNEKTRRGTNFQVNLDSYKNEAQKKIVQKAMDSGILNDSKKTHSFVDLVSKLAADKGMDFDFVNNQKIIESGFGVEGKTVNGYVNGNTIGLNIESNNALNKTVGHEITHVLEGSDLYQALQDSLKSYIGEDTWNKRIKELTETYKNVENADVSKELTADLVGENLFNNEDFVRSLSTKDRNLFQKIFDEIKYLVQIATAGSKEKRELVKLQKVFQEAYRNSKTTKEGTRYSLNSDAIQNLADITGESYSMLEANLGDNDYSAKNYLTRHTNLVENYMKENNINVEPVMKQIESKQSQEYQDFVKNNDISVMKLANDENLLNKYFDIERNEFSDLPERAMDDLIEHQRQLFDMAKHDNEVPNSLKRYDREFGYIRDNVQEVEDTIETERKIQKEVVESPEFQKYLDELVQPLFHKEAHTVEEVMEEAKYNHGTTDNYEVGAYMTTDGELLDFGDHGYRDDHRTVDAFDLDMNEFMEYGAIRMKPESNGFELNQEPTSEQYSKLYDYIDDYCKNNPNNGDIVVDIDTSRNNYDSQFYNINTPTSKIINDIKTYYETGSFPKQSEFADFRYSLSEDNNGRKLTEAQNEYFKDSKARDDNGNLVTVYHTTTDKVAQFNEFDPTGTDYYKFGDQVVNYFTDDKNMSGSYADQYYEMADTKKLTSIEEVNEYLKQFNDSFNTEYNPSGNADYVVREENGKYNVYNDVEKGIIDSANDFISTLNQEEKDFIKKYIQDGASKTLFEDRYGLTPEQEEYIKKYENWAFNQYSPKSLSKAPQNYLAMLLMDTYNNRPIASYDSKEQLFRNIKTDLEVENYDKRSRLQYEGYVNLTNPYVIDAEGRTWNKVESKADSDLTKRLLEVTEEDRRYLESLASDSIKTYNDNLFNYQQADRAINDFAVDRTNTTLEQRLIHRTIHDLGFEDFMKVLNNEDVYWGRKEQFMDDAFNNGFATLKQREEYNKTGNIPAEVLEKVDKLIHEPAKYEDRYMRKELEALGMPPEIKTTTIYDLWNNQQQTYKTFDEGGRYEYSKFNQQVNERNLYRALGNEELFKVAKRGFTDENVRLLYNDWSVTNDIVKKIIDLNKYGENYDGVIMKNVVDYGGESEVHTPHDLYITFNSNQFKAVDNLKPTDDPDIRYQLGTNEIAPTNGWEVRGEDIRLQSAVQETIAPLQEQVQQLQNTIQDLRDNIAPLSEEEAVNLPIDENIETPTRYNLTQEESQRLDFLDRLERENMLTESLAEERDNLRAKEENIVNEEDMTPIESLNDVRDVEEVGDRKVKAYQYEHPEVKPYFQEEARNMLNDLNNSTKGERYAVPGQSQNINEWNWIGLKRNTSPEIEMLLDGDLGAEYTYDDIRKGLNAIIEDNGAENIAVAKRIEFLLDERLRNGYDQFNVMDENYQPYHVEPNQDYLNMLREQSWDRYYEQSPWLENAPAEIEEPVIRMTPEQIAPTRETITEKPTRDSMELIDLQNSRNIAEQRTRTPKQQNNPFIRLWDFVMGRGVNRNVLTDRYSKQSGNRDIKFKADLRNNSMAEASYNITDGQTNINFETVGEGLDTIFKDLDKLKIPKAVANEFLIDYSNVDRWRNNKGSATPYEESVKRLKDYAIKYPELKSWAERIWKYGENSLQNRVDAGLIAQEDADYMRKIYPHYVPYINDVDNIDRIYEQSKELKAQDLKRAKGGATKLMPVYDALVRYTMAEKQAIRDNDLYREIVKTNGRSADIGIDERLHDTDLSTSLYSDATGNYLIAYENGRQITTQIDADLFKELSRESERKIKEIEDNLSLIIKPLQKVNEFNRNIHTTVSLTFPLKNAFKDFGNALFNSKHTAKMVKNYLPGLVELINGKSKDAQQFKAGYGSGMTMGDFGYDTLNSKIKNNKFLKGIRAINEFVELAPRFAEFKASRQSGESIAESLYNAREITMNFSRGGTWVKAANRDGATFLNSSVQGLDKIIRNFSGENGAKGVASSLIKVAMFGIVPAVFNDLAFGGGSDDEDEDYKALPNYIKDNYYLIKKGNGEFIRIPKAQLFAVVGSAARRTMEKARGEEDAFEGFMDNVDSQIGVNNLLEDNVFAPIIQINKGREVNGERVGEAWHGGEIVPTRLQDKPLREQYDEKTDNFSIWLGDKLNISPKKINYVLDQYSGGVGDVVLPWITEQASSGAETPLEYAMATVKDQFTANNIDDNKYVSNFYSKKAEITSIAGSDNATDEEQLQKKYLDGISKQMSDLYAERRQIQMDSSLSKKEKFARANEIKKQINALAKEGLDTYKNISTTGDYSNVNGTEYQKTDNGWTKVKDDTSQEINSYGLNDSEKNTYFKTKSNIAGIKSKYKGSNDYASKKTDIVNEIRSANLPDDAKIGLYQDAYNDKMAQKYVDAGVSADAYLDFKSRTFTADKDKNGKSISGSKKQKVFNYINSMDIPFEQKLMLVKTEYPSYKEYNKQIVEYLNNSEIDYNTMIELLKDMGFKINGNNVSW